MMAHYPRAIARTPRRHTYIGGHCVEPDHYFTTG
jgi:hypothetical protein